MPPLSVDAKPTFSSPQIAGSNSQEADKVNTILSKDQILERSSLLAKKYRGECLSTSFSICKGRNSIKFRCQNNHTFFVPVETIESLNVIENKSVIGAASSKILASSNDWCYKCKKFYQSCKEVAAKNDIQVVDGLFSSKITLKCQRRSHLFKISYSKKLQTLSCSDCRKEEREEWKENLRQEELRKNEFYLR